VPDFILEELKAANTVVAARQDLANGGATMLDAFPNPLLAQAVVPKQLRAGYRYFGARDANGWVALAQTTLKPCPTGGNARYIEQITAIEGRGAGGPLTGFILRQAELEGCTAVTLTAARKDLRDTYTALGFDRDPSGTEDKFILHIKDVGLHAFMEEIKNGGEGAKCYYLNDDTYKRLPGNVRKLIKAYAAPQNIV
jgi:hypothetical protein